MPNPMQAIQGDFEKLAGRLTALIEFYANEPTMAYKVDGLRAARDKAVRAAELARCENQRSS